MESKTVRSGVMSLDCKNVQNRTKIVEIIEKYGILYENILAEAK